MTVARIEQGLIVEIKDMSYDDIPASKRWAFLPVVDVRPEHDIRFQKLEGPSYVVTATEVTATYKVVDLNNAVHEHLAQEEYTRRLLAILSARDLAHAAFIRADNDIEFRSFKQRVESGEVLNEDDAKWFKDIEVINTKVSALIEAYNLLPIPLPPDFTDDKYWSKEV